MSSKPPTKFGVLSNAFKKLSVKSSSQATAGKRIGARHIQLEEEEGIPKDWELDASLASHIIPCIECKDLDCLGKDNKPIWESKLASSKDIVRHGWKCLLCSTFISPADIQKMNAGTTKKSPVPYIQMALCGCHYVHTECVLKWRLEQDLQPEQEAEGFECIYCSCDVCDKSDGEIFEFGCGCLYHRKCLGEEIFSVMEMDECCPFCNLITPNKLSNLDIPSISEKHFIKLKRCGAGHLIFFGPFQLFLMNQAGIGKMEKLHELGITFRDLKRAGLSIKSILCSRHFSIKGIADLGGIPALLKTFYGRKEYHDSGETLLTFSQCMEYILECFECFCGSSSEGDNASLDSFSGDETDSVFFDIDDEEDKDEDSEENLDLNPYTFKKYFKLEKDDLLNMKITCAQVLDYGTAEEWISAYGASDMGNLLCQLSDFEYTGMRFNLSTNRFPTINKPDPKQQQPQPQPQQVKRHIKDDHSSISEEVSADFHNQFFAVTSRILDDDDLLMCFFFQKSKQ